MFIVGGHRRQPTPEFTPHKVIFATQRRNKSTVHNKSAKDGKKRYKSMRKPVPTHIHRSKSVLDVEPNVKGSRSSSVSNDFSVENFKVIMSMYKQEKAAKIDAAIKR